MSETKQPQDHKPKSDRYPFTDSEGNSHTLPLIKTGAKNLTGADLMDAALAGEPGQITYLFQMLVAVKPSAKALAALRAMPQDEMLEIVNAWAEHGDGDGASLGK